VFAISIKSAERVLKEGDIKIVHQKKRSGRKS
jgi:hypothetical protein